MEHPCNQISPQWHCNYSGSSFLAQENLAHPTAASISTLHVHFLDFVDMTLQSSLLLSSEHSRLSGRQGWNCLIITDFLLAFLQAGLSLLLALQTVHIGPFYFVSDSVHLYSGLFWLKNQFRSKMSAITKCKRCPTFYLRISISLQSILKSYITTYLI